MARCPSRPLRITCGSITNAQAWRQRRLRRIPISTRARRPRPCNVLRSNNNSRRFSSADMPASPSLPTPALPVGAGLEAPIAWLRRRLRPAIGVAPDGVVSGPRRLRVVRTSATGHRRLMRSREITGSGASPFELRRPSCMTALTTPRHTAHRHIALPLIRRPAIARRLTTRLARRRPLRGPAAEAISLLPRATPRAAAGTVAAAAITAASRFVTKRQNIFADMRFGQCLQPSGRHSGARQLSRSPANRDREGAGCGGAASLFGSGYAGLGSGAHRSVGLHFLLKSQKMEQSFISTCCL